MCRFQILSQTNSGYVVYCNDCRRIQLAFGTTMVKIEPDNFHRLKETVAMECIYRNPCSEPELKNIIIPIYEETMLCLCYNELLKLERLTQEASVLFETYQILEQD